MCGSELAPAGVDWAGRKTSPGLLRFARLQSALGSLPSVALSSAGAKGVFPVSVPLGVYRAGNGKRQFELIAPGVPHDFALVG